MAKVDLRPMSTAPKDGTEILVWLVNGPKWYVVWWSSFGRDWSMGYDSFEDHDLLGWIPLPEPPTEVECG